MNKQVCISKPYESIIEASKDAVKFKSLFNINELAILARDEIYFRADLLGALFMTGHITRGKYKKYIKPYIYALEGKYKLWSKQRCKVSSIYRDPSIDVEKNIYDILNIHKISNKRIFGKGKGFIFVSESEAYMKEIELLIADGDEK